jgi:hypothetical protein
MLDYEGELIAVIVKQAQSKSKGTITEVGLESVHGDQAQVLSRYR